MALAFCSNEHMTPKEALINSLIALCERQGAQLVGEDGAKARQRGAEVVAAKAGVSADNLKQILAGTKLGSGEPRGVGPTLQRKLEAAFPGWAHRPLVEEMLSIYNVAAIDQAPKRVPLISWVAAGHLDEIEDHFEPGDAHEWVEAYDSNPGPSSFALRVVGDSMTSPIPGALSFPEGTVIVVDPARGCDAGDFVVAKDVISQKATFKKLVTDGGRWYLRPLNPTFPTVEIDDPHLRVIGRVVEYQTRGKL